MNDVLEKVGLKAKSSRDGEDASGNKNKSGSLSLNPQKCVMQAVNYANKHSQSSLWVLGSRFAGLGTHVDFPAIRNHCTCHLAFTQQKEHRPVYSLLPHQFPCVLSFSLLGSLPALPRILHYLLVNEADRNDAFGILQRQSFAHHLILLL